MNEQATVEEKFRESLKEVLVVVRRLSPHCKNVDELMGLLEVSTENDAQLRLIMSKF